MAIDDIITTLANIDQSIDQGIPKTADSPDALVNHLNDLYGESDKDLSLGELFTYDDVGNPSTTLTVDIGVEFDPRRIMEIVQTRLQIIPQEEADEIGRTGVVWSCGHYDFVFDDDLRQLRISHRYSHRPKDTQSVLSILRKMIDYAKSYLQAIKESTEEGTGTPETE